LINLRVPPMMTVSCWASCAECRRLPHLVFLLRGGVLAVLCLPVTSVEVTAHSSSTGRPVHSLHTCSSMHATAAVNFHMSQPATLLQWVTLTFAERFR